MVRCSPAHPHFPLSVPAFSSRQGRPLGICVWALLTAGASGWSTRGVVGGAGFSTAFTISGERKIYDWETFKRTRDCAPRLYWRRKKVLENRGWNGALRSGEGQAEAREERCFDQGIVVFECGIVRRSVGFWNDSQEYERVAFGLPF